MEAIVTAQRAPNSRLRDVIDAVGCTYEALARDVRRVAAENGEIQQTNKSAISHWVNGTRAPSGRVGQYLAEALSRRAGRTITQTEIGLQAGDDEEPAESDPVLAVTDLGRADVERRRFLAIAAFTTAGVAMPLGYDHEATARMLRARTGMFLVGAEDVDVVRQITAAFSAADERLGGGHGLTTVTAYLADTAAPPCCADASPAKAYAGQRSARSPSWPTSQGGSTTTSARKAPPSATTRSATSSPAKPTPPRPRRLDDASPRPPGPEPQATPPLRRPRRRRPPARPRPR
ncbi:hypothetical protein GCM10020295_28740 [Streptomyces cinereospinus]